MLRTFGRRLAVLALFLFSSPAVAFADHPWPHSSPAARTLERTIAAPDGFRRISAPIGSFAAWLRALPMKPDGTPVTLHDGRLKSSQGVHAAVIDIDVGEQDLQQCADAVMRLRAEYLLASGRAKDIAFNYTNGKRVAYANWKGGDYKTFRRYMKNIFSYAGTYSLEREMTPIATADMRIGDVFIKGGFPGHAVLIIDMAENARTGEKRFLLMQSFMPAQDMHILKNPAAQNDDPWYPLPLADDLATPEWTFKSNALRRFKAPY